MSTTTNLDSLIINYLTQAQYDTALANNQINANELYLTPMEGNSSVTLITATLAAANWNNNSQTIVVTGVTTSNSVIVSAAAASENTYLSCEVRCSSQANDSLTFTCATTPTVAIDVNILIFSSN